VKGRAAFAGERVGGGDWRTELAGNEGVESAETRGKFGGGQAALAVERAEKILGGAFALLRVALETTRDEVAVRIAPQLHAGHDVVEAVNAGGEPAEAIKAVTTLACMDCQAQRLRFQEVRVFEVDGARDASRVASRANLLGQPHFDHVTCLAALDQTQGTVGDETANGFARGGIREARSSGEPGNGKVQPAAAFEATVPKKVGINGAVYDGQAQPGDEKVFKLFPDLFGVGFPGFHGLDPGWKCRLDTAEIWTFLQADSSSAKAGEKQNAGRIAPCWTGRAGGKRKSPGYDRGAVLYAGKSTRAVLTSSRKKIRSRQAKA